MQQVMKNVSSGYEHPFTPYLCSCSPGVQGFDPCPSVKQIPWSTDKWLYRFNARSRKLGTQTVAREMVDFVVAFTHYHWSSLIIDHHWSLIIIDHWSSLIIDHWSLIIDHHWSLIIIDHWSSLIASFPNSMSVFSSTFFFRNWLLVKTLAPSEPQVIAGIYGCSSH